MRARSSTLSQNESCPCQLSLRRKSSRATFLSAALALSAVAFTSVPARAQDSSQSGDPIADAARRSREAKQNAAKPKKVYTDDDISRRKPAPSPTDANAASPNAATTAAPANAAAPGDEDAKNEALWRKSFKDQREKITRAEKELDILQRESQKKEIQYYPDPQKAMNEQYTRKDVNETLAKIEAKRQEIAQLKQGLSDLEDALRKAGGNPGWSRE
jgi:chromosome segregation ATPase